MKFWRPSCLQLTVCGILAVIFFLASRHVCFLIYFSVEILFPLVYFSNFLLIKKLKMLSTYSSILTYPDCQRIYRFSLFSEVVLLKKDYHTKMKTHNHLYFFLNRYCILYEIELGLYFNEEVPNM